MPNGEDRKGRMGVCLYSVEFAHLEPDVFSLHPLAICVPPALHHLCDAPSCDQESGDDEGYHDGSACHFDIALFGVVFSHHDCTVDGLELARPCFEVEGPDVVSYAVLVFVCAIRFPHDIAFAEVRARLMCDKNRDEREKYENAVHEM